MEKITGTLKNTIAEILGYTRHFKIIRNRGQIKMNNFETQIMSTIRNSLESYRGKISEIIRVSQLKLDSIIKKSLDSLPFGGKDFLKNDLEDKIKSKLIYNIETLYRCQNSQFNSYIII